MVVPLKTYKLAAGESIPNHPRWPLLIYPGAVALSGKDPAALFEELFTRNGWPAAWRNGVHPFHHYHSTSHEVLGISPDMPEQQATFDECLSSLKDVCTATTECSTEGSNRYACFHKYCAANPDVSGCEPYK